MNKRDEKELREALQSVSLALSATVSKSAASIMAKLAFAGSTVNHISQMFEEEATKAADEMIRLHVLAGSKDADTIAQDIRDRIDAPHKAAVAAAKTAGGLSPGTLVRFEHEMHAQFDSMMSAPLKGRVSAELLQKRKSTRRLDRLQDWAKDNRVVAAVAVASIVAATLKSTVEAIIWLWQHARPLLHR